MKYHSKQLHTAQPLMGKWNVTYRLSKMLSSYINYTITIKFELVVMGIQKLDIQQHTSNVTIPYGRHTNMSKSSEIGGHVHKNH